MAVIIGYSTAIVLARAVAVTGVVANLTLIAVTRLYPVTGVVAHRAAVKLTSFISVARIITDGSAVTLASGKKEFGAGPGIAGPVADGTAVAVAGQMAGPASDARILANLSAVAVAGEVVDTRVPSDISAVGIADPNAVTRAIGYLAAVIGARLRKAVASIVANFSTVVETGLETVAGVMAHLRG